MDVRAAENALALLSNFEKETLDPPSAGRLGHFCIRKQLRKSGLVDLPILPLEAFRKGLSGWSRACRPSR